MPQFEQDQKMASLDCDDCNIFSEIRAHDGSPEPPFGDPPQDLVSETLPLYCCNHYITNKFFFCLHKTCYGFVLDLRGIAQN